VLLDLLLEKFGTGNCIVMYKGVTTSRKAYTQVSGSAERPKDDDIVCSTWEHVAGIAGSSLTNYSEHQVITKNKVTK